jgi:hypothetical protein
MDKADIYIQEVETQILYAKKCFSNYQLAKYRDDIPCIFFHVHHFLIHIANIDKILNPKPSSPRASMLRDRIELNDINLKQFRKMRNHLEHFDERLDEWIKNYEGHAFFDMNLVAGAKGFPQKAFLRALDGDIFKFHGESYDLNELYRKVIAIEDSIKK